MVNLIRKTDIFKIKPGCSSAKNSKFMDLFEKSSTFINIEELLKNYKICIRENWGQNKDRTNIFEGNENTNVKRNNKTMIDSDYNNNNIIYLIVGYTFSIASKVNCYFFYISNFF